MAGTAKIAVSLDPTLLEELERVRERTGESRSAAVSRAIRLLTLAEQRAQRVREYVEAYRRAPETTDEIDAARRVAKRSLVHSVAWEDE